MERGRVDAEDLQKIHLGRQLTQALLDYAHLLTARQQEVIAMYYRQAMQQQEIADSLGITQQAVNDSLKRARLTIGKLLKSGEIDFQTPTSKEADPSVLTTEDAGDSANHSVEAPTETRPQASDSAARPEATGPTKEGSFQENPHKRHSAHLFESNSPSKQNRNEPGFSKFDTRFGSDE